MAKIALIGLSKVGFHMGKDLSKAEHSVTGLDLSEAASAAYRKAGGSKKRRRPSAHRRRLEPAPPRSIRRSPTTEWAPRTSRSSPNC